MTLQDKILKLMNEYYKEDGTQYDSFIMYAFNEKGNELAMRAIYHKIGVIKMMSAKENIELELEDGMKEALERFTSRQMH
ncbi:MAG: hypothetical protein [Caudovirales sp. ctOwN3]|nr:MAG: hypothetical protein [Caudovirales sp. ctOwN3]